MKIYSIMLVLLLFDGGICTQSSNPTIPYVPPTYTYNLHLSRTSRNQKNSDFVIQTYRLMRIIPFYAIAFLIKGVHLLNLVCFTPDTSLRRIIGKRNTHCEIWLAEKTVCSHQAVALFCYENSDIIWKSWSRC